MFHVVIEQTKEYEHRMKYDPETNTFVETEYKSLFFVRGCPYPYGWLKESGTPPGPHLDVILISSKVYPLGSEETVRVIGCFFRADGDHKLICVPKARTETDLADLPQNERDYLARLYPHISEEQGEGFFGVDRAMAIVEGFLGTRSDA